MTLTSFRNVQLMQDPDAGARAAEAIPILASVHHGVTGCPKQAKIAAGIHQNKLPASDHPPSVSLMPFPIFQTSSSVCLSHSRNGFIPGVIIANGCTIFVHFHPRQGFI